MKKSTALATVKESKVLKISTSPRAQREQRGQSLAKDLVKFIGDMVPRILQVRQDFLDREPDETICGVTTFRDYCTGALGYSHSHIRNLIAGQTPASEKYSSKKHTQITAEAFAEYEATPEGKKIRPAATKLLKTMEPDDVVGALTGESFGFPKPMAEAVVQIETGQPLATAATNSDIFDDFWKKVVVLAPLNGDGNEHVFVQMALDAIQTPITNEAQYGIVCLLILELRNVSADFIKYAEGLEKALKRSPDNLKASDLMALSLDNIGNDENPSHHLRMIRRVFSV